MRFCVSSRRVVLSVRLLSVSAKIVWTVSSSLSSSDKRARARSERIRKRFKSKSFSSVDSSRYTRALRLCSSSGFRRFVSSSRISSTRSRFSSVRCNFLSASSLRALNLTMPAASSNTCRRSSLLRERISSMRPCPMIEYPSLPMPVSRKRSTTSFKRQAVRFK